MDIDFETIQLIQEEFQNDFTYSRAENVSDSVLALNLQREFDQGPSTSYGDLVYDNKNRRKDATKSLVDPSWEIVDPTPDIHVLFIAFNSKFFWGKLDSVCISWSKRMKRCAGICSYQGRGGLCRITLSEPLLKLRPRKDLIETMLHEMIHAYLFVTHNNRDRDGHGPEFHKHMYRINKEAGTNITVYHDFHDEVKLYLTHWWRCDGPCQKWKPYFGIVRRSSNRAPGPYDRWFGQHSRSCGGTFIKIKSPEPKVKETKKTKQTKSESILNKFFPNLGVSSHSGNNLKSNSTTSGSKSNPNIISKNSNFPKNHTASKSSSGLTSSVIIPSKTNNIHGFSNSSSTTQGKSVIKVNSNSDVTNKPKNNSQEGKILNSIKSGVFPKDSLKTIDANDTSIDYSVVRNHWINKFSNSQNDNSKSPDSKKRKATKTITSAAKTTKIDTSSQDSLDCGSAACPVCNISYPIEELNLHLDTCLNEPKSNCKECIICLKDIDKSEYEKHVNGCIDKNFRVENSPKKKNDSIIVIDDDSLDVEYVVCEICKNQIKIESLEKHLEICKNRTECPECRKKVDSDKYDTHLAGCLMKIFDEINNDLNKGKKETNKAETSDEKEKITCLVCGKCILKNNLYSHLDECVKEVFDDEEEQKEETEDNDDDETLFNCPFCLKLVAEIDMSDHIDICLKCDGNTAAQKIPCV